MFSATAAADAVQRYIQDNHGNDGTSTSLIAENGCDVIVFEGTSKTMSKVRISGGGRCNVMHDTTKPLPQILSSYPRGTKELRGLYTKRFTPSDAYDWFTSRGVSLKTESDGRMFPTTDDSQTIIDTIYTAALDSGVEVRMKEKVESVEWIADNGTEDATDASGHYVVNTSSKSPTSSERVQSQEQFDALILATGSFPLGHVIAKSLGHEIVKPVPSLFTFDAKDLVNDGGVFNGLAGVSVPWAQLTLVVNDEMMGKSSSSENEAKLETTIEASPSDKPAKKKRKRKKKAPTIIQEGPLLITHHGVSGPAALRLSAFAAREFHAVKYNCHVKIHFCPKWEEEQTAPKGISSNSGEGIVFDTLWNMSRLIPKRNVATSCPLFMKGTDENGKSIPVMPKRLWQALVQYSNIPEGTTWGDASKSMIRALSNNISAFQLHVTSKGIFKEEFVTAGGVHLKEVKMSTMESKIRPGLFMCGEVLDVDGVTGGFNFMGCWSTGFVAGEGAATFCCETKKLILE